MLTETRMADWSSEEKLRDTLLGSDMFIAAIQDIKNYFILIILYIEVCFILLFFTVLQLHGFLLSFTFVAALLAGVYQMVMREGSWEKHSLALFCRAKSGHQFWV